LINHGLINIIRFVSRFTTHLYKKFYKYTSFSASNWEDSKRKIFLRLQPTELNTAQESCSSFPSMSRCNFSSSLTYGTFKLWPSCTQIICHMMTWTILQHLQAKHTVASWLYSYLNLFLRNFICRLGASPSDLRSFDIDNHIAVWGWEVLNLSWLMRTMLAYNMHKASQQKNNDYRFKQSWVLNLIAALFGVLQQIGIDFK